MVKYFMSKDDDGKWHGQIIDDSEGTIGQSRQITRFRENVELAILQFVTKSEKLLFPSTDKETEIRAAKFRNEMNKILSKNHFETFLMYPKADPEKPTRLGIMFEFESTEG